MRNPLRNSWLAGTVLAVSLPVSVQAAPQMLGLPQTAGATPLYCSGGSCTAELSAFCLQADRDAPRAGTVYKPVDPNSIVLQLTRADGSVISRPAVKFARFASARGHFAVRITIDRATLKRLGAVKAAVRVGTQVSLVPNRVAGDTRPHKAAEIRSVSRELRAEAAPLADGDRPDAVAARALNRAINLLPFGNDTDPRWRRSLWSKAIKGVQGTNASPVGLGLVRQWQRICRGYPLQRGAYRLCLERGHDSLIGQVNRDYWKITGAGS
jgi:hypothetical protein